MNKHDTIEKQPESLKLAEWLDMAATTSDMGRKPEKNDHLRLSAVELRRLYQVNQELVFALQNLLDVKEGKGGTKFNSDDIARAAIAKASIK